MAKFMETPTNIERVSELMELKPLGSRILVRIQEAETKTRSGIIIPDTAQEKMQSGVVVAVGDDKETIKVTVGQKVMYDKYAGSSIKVDGVDHLIVKMDDVIAIIS